MLRPRMWQRVKTHPAYLTYYERLCATGEAFIYVAMSRLMVKHLARS